MLFKDFILQYFKFTFLKAKRYAHERKPLMFTLAILEKNSPITYQGFSQDFLSLNLLSNIGEPLPYIYEFADAGLIMMHQNGIMIEVEYIFSQRANFKDYPNITSQKVEIGIPIFKLSNQAHYETTPTIFIQEATRNICMFFDEHTTESDLRIQHQDMCWLFKQETCIGIEVKNCILDIDNRAQENWLKEHIILI